MIPLVEVPDEFTVGHAFLLYAVAHYATHKLRLKGVGSKAALGALLALRALCALMLVDLVVGSLVLPAAHIVEQGEKVSFGWTPRLVPVHSDEGVELFNLSVVVFETKKNTDIDATIVFFNPNGVGFEKILPYLASYAKDLGADRAIGVNYRGVGKSTGKAKRGQDLVDDGSEVVNWTLNEFQLEESQLIIHGWSLGGAVALKVKERFPSVMVISDRSFSSLGDAGQAMLRDPMAGGALGIGLGLLVSFVLASSIEEFRRIAQVLGGVFGVACALGYLRPFIPEILNFFDWNIVAPLDLVKKGGPFLCVIHPDDGMIVHETASIHRLIDWDVKEFNTNVFEFQMTHPASNGVAAHMMPLFQAKSDWKMFISTVKDLFLDMD